MVNIQFRGEPLKNEQPKYFYQFGWHGQNWRQLLLSEDWRDTFFLDCGSGRIDGINFYPPFNLLLRTPYLQDLHQISHVIISHGHLDHIGALPEFLKLNDRVNVYMTDLTLKIAQVQLKNKLSAVAQEKISVVHFLQMIP